MNICVFCSAQNVPEQYQKAAQEFGVLIGKGGHTLVWGGSNVGLMKIIADEVQKNGGKLRGVSMAAVAHKARTDADDMLVAQTLAERKAVMLEYADAFVALPGGLGTLDEITEIIALRRHDLHQKVSVFLNSEGFYDGIKAQFETMEREGFLGNADNDVVPGLKGVAHFADTPEGAMRYIEGHGS